MVNIGRGSEGINKKNQKNHTIYPVSAVRAAKRVRGEVCIQTQMINTLLDQRRLTTEYFFISSGAKCFQLLKGLNYRQALLL